MKIGLRTAIPSPSSVMVSGDRYSIQPPTSRAKTLRLNEREFRVVVMPDGFSGMGRVPDLDSDDYVLGWNVGEILSCAPRAGIRRLRG